MHTSRLFIVFMLLLRVRACLFYDTRNTYDRRNKKKYLTSSTIRPEKGTLDRRNPLRHLLCSSSLKRMERSEWYKIIAILTNTQSRTTTRSLSSGSYPKSCKELNCSPRWISDGDTTMFRSRKATVTVFLLLVILL